MRSAVRWKAWKLLLVLALLVPVAGSSSPASASASNYATGAAEFEGTATLAKFPCSPPPPYGTGPCQGSFQGQWSGHLNGMSSGRAFEVSWRTLASQGVTANFDFHEDLCAIPTASSSYGYAKGTGTAYAGSGEATGYMTTSDPTRIPMSVNEVRMDFTFTWTRAGNVAALILSPVSLRLNVFGPGWVTVLNTQQLGAADFVPTGSSTPGGVPNCTTPLTTVHGTITGGITFAHNP